MKDGDAITLTYELSVQPNVTGEDITYTLTDTIPSGLTYVPGSATGGAVVSGNVLTWTGTMIGGFVYSLTDNTTDPTCTTPFGGYVNLADSGIYAKDTIMGDTSLWSAFTDFTFPFYGDAYTGLYFGDDGFGLFDAAANYGGTPWVPQAIPDPDKPNAVVAPFWRDLEIVYDQATNKGVSLAEAGSLAIVEYDDVIPYGGDGSEHFDFEMFVSSEVGSGPEISFAYDNLVGDIGSATVGIENHAGDAAEVYTGVITDGLVVCIDYVGPTDPHQITYQVTVDDVPAAMDGKAYVNTVDHIIDNVGAEVEAVSHTFQLRTLFMPVVFRNFGN
jgi:uncharacterized repeat protein (TIGR01451 family)